ncbi:hypothetical protein F52700_680 [Fusarium sp. NRRL 52700]|nr:hypothetical protein F52700_680 [Fusarium sp. NRRL 52700]
MSEPASQNKLSLQEEPEEDQSRPGPSQSGKHGSAEDDLTEGKKPRADKTVRFKEGPKKMVPKDEKSRNEDSKKQSAPTRYNFSLWDGETIRELNNCLVQAKASLKRVQTRVKKLEDKKKELLEEEEDLEAKIALFKRSIQKKRSLALFVDMP